MADCPLLLDIAPQLVEHEGDRRLPYRDSRGFWTVGIGHLMSRPLSKRVVDMIFQEDVETHWTELVTALPWVLDLDRIRQRVLLDMAFNLGVPGLLKFRKTLASFKAGAFQKAADELEASEPWASQVGRRARTLAQMTRTGVDPWAVRR